MPLDDDYSNHIPPQVRAAAELAEQFAREVNAAPPEEGADDAPPAGDDPPPNPQPASPAPPSVEEDWQQKFATLQGKYNTEIGGLRGELISMQNLIASMNTAPAPAAPVPVPATTTTVVVPEAHTAEYGADLIDAVRLWARAEMQPLLNDLKAQVDAMKADVTNVRGSQTQMEATSVKGRVMSGLDADPELAGRWRNTNNDPAFLSWLNTVDEFSGLQRMQMLRSAFEQGDTMRTARFFKTYLAEHTATEAPPAAAPHTPATPAAGGDRPSLESLAAPGRPVGQGAAPGGASTEKRQWRKQEISAFYRDRSTGKYTGREDEAARLEADIYAAAREGRVN